MDLTELQRALREQGLDGWLFYDFRRSDPYAYSILGLDESSCGTRRWFYFVPAAGEPVKIVHRIEQHVLAALPGRSLTYLPWQQLHEHLRSALAGCRRVAMQYSPLSELPPVSTVDAGTVELVRSMGVEVVSSADLVQRFEAVWSEEQYQMHLAAGRAVSEIVDWAFEEIKRRTASGEQADEYTIQQLMWERFEPRGICSDSPPIVAAGPNTADPHYMPSSTDSRPIQPGDVVLIDIWARLDKADAVYFDITWTGYAGSDPPQEVQAVFEAVVGARDAALQAVREAVRAGRPIRGCDVDDVARQFLNRLGYGEQFIHRTGHSIHRQVHGPGANLDNLETCDRRPLIPRTCFSIEPGVYLPGRFGIRSEIDVYLTGNDAVVTVRQPQRELIRCL